MDDDRLAPIVNSREAGKNDIEELRRFRALTPALILNDHFPGSAAALMIPTESSGAYTPLAGQPDWGTTGEPTGST
jgi:hypothetical protein